MNAITMCLNWKVIAGLAAVGLGVALFAPRALAAALPLLVLAACPLSMILMMGAMGGMGMRSKDRATEPLPEVAPATGGTREGQLADLTRRLAQIQRDQEAVARAIANLESDGAAASDPTRERLNGVQRNEEPRPAVEALRGS